MPFNGSGVFQRVRNWVADAAAGIKIRADYHDAEDDGFAAGLTNCITRDGQSLVTQNIPFNSKRVTGLQDPVNPQDAATKAYADTKLSAIGGKMTGNLEIEKDCPEIILDDTDACGSSIVGQHIGKDRWRMYYGNGAAESTGSAGSNFDLRRYADDGTTLLGTSITINRASGRMDINGDLYVSRGVNEGVLYLGSNGLHYLYWSGVNYVMPGGRLQVGAYGVNGLDVVTVDQLNTRQPNLGFTPVQQGGGAAQTADKVYIGWDGGGLRAQVNSLDLGRFIFGGSAILNIRWLHAGASYPPGSDGGWMDPFPNSVIYLYAGVTNIVGFQHKYLQVYTTSWYTVGH